MTKPRARRAKPSAPTVPAEFTLPVREWDRMTELVRMFVMTGWLARTSGRAQSLILISEPGNGKSELLDRYLPNGTLQFVSDLTSQGLHPILKHMQTGAVTHIVATEFQKFFLRKSSTAENTLGTLCQMMEEGVREVRVGQQVLDFRGAQGGIIGAITHQTVKGWRSKLHEFGFWSRCAAFEWEMPQEELMKVLSRISHGDKTDLDPVILTVPPGKMTVDFPPALSHQFEEFVSNQFRQHTVLRVFLRFRALAMACALIDGRDYVHARDVEKVVAYNLYWSRMIRG